MKKIILLTVILSTTHCYTMKRAWSYQQEIDDTKKRKISAVTFCNKPSLQKKPKLPKLPRDMLNLIVDIAIYEPNTKKPREAAKTVRALSICTTYLNSKINNLDFTDRIINDYSSRFLCSHESIAKFLATEAAKTRLALQYNLKRMCTHSSEAIISKTLDNFEKDKRINLEFTYNDKSGLQKTPLMLCMNSNPWIFSLLLEYGANINTGNAHGMTVLHLGSHYPIQPYAIRTIINWHELNIDQQNNRGETALLHSLKDRRRANINITFIQAIDNLLTRADPEIIDKEGNSPFTVAKELGNLRIMNLIDQAILRKHKKQQETAAEQEKGG